MTKDISYYKQAMKNYSQIILEVSLKLRKQRKIKFNTKANVHFYPILYCNIQRAEFCSQLCMTDLIFAIQLSLCILLEKHSSNSALKSPT